jgi:NADH-quinone oxidoreductase subunit J
MDALLFMIFAAIAVICGINLVVQTHPISSALSLVGVMGALAALYLLLGGEFIAAAQLVVYAGAIMVLFVFVIMLLNLPADPTDEKETDRLRWLKFIGIPLGIFLLLLVGATVWNVGSAANATQMNGTAEAIGQSMFTDYLLPFELTSLLILIALMGAVVFAKKDL